MPLVNLEEIKANCPRCGCSREKIEYYNCGPSGVFVLCPDCRFHVNMDINETNPREAMFDTWNTMSSDS